MNLQKTKAFTLVELIVVITILAILGTIAFISMQGYSKSSRDSVRTSDMSKIKSSLELFNIGAGKYPSTTGGVTVTYTGETVWTQGLFGDTTFTNVDRLDKIPKDPLTDKEYTYSVLNTGQEYEIAGLMEGDDFAFNPLLLNPLFAAGEKIARAKITGNYNGKIAKIKKGTDTVILAVPTIISGSGVLLDDIIKNKTFVYTGYSNLPFSYNGTAYNSLGESPSLNLVDENNYVVFTGDVSTLKGENPDARILMLENLKTAYSGSSIEDSTISELLSITDFSSTNPLVVSLAGTVVNNTLGGSIVGTDTSSNTTSSSENRLVYNAVAYTGNGGSQDVVTGIESYDINYDATRTYTKGSGDNTEYAFDREKFKLYKYINDTPKTGADAYLGDNLIINGNFDIDTNSWNGNNISLNSNRLNLVSTSSSNHLGNNEVININSNKKYIFSIDLIDHNGAFRVYEGQSGNDILPNSTYAKNQTYVYDYHSYSNTTFRITMYGATINSTALIDNVSLKETFPSSHWEEVTDDIIIPFKSSKIWVKSRSSIHDHVIFDTLRGETNGIFTNNTVEETDKSQYNFKFTDNGYSVNNNTSLVNADTYTYIAWQQSYHKVMITTTNHGKRALVAFDDVSKRSMTLYQGSGNTEHEISHGLGVIPNISTIKSLGLVEGWSVVGDSMNIAGDETLTMNDTNQIVVRAGRYNSLDNTNVVIGSNSQVNTVDVLYMNYNEANSSNIKIGTYTGDFVNGKEIHIGFKPAYLMIKGIDYAGHWTIFDNKRNFGDRLWANENYSEDTGAYANQLSDGFSLFSSDQVNGLNYDYLYIAYGDSQSNGGGSYADIPAGY